MGSVVDGGVHLLRVVDGNRVVYVLRNGQAVQVKVVLGQSSDTMSVLAGGEVKEGELIILNPPANFGPGGGPGGGMFGG